MRNYAWIICSRYQKPIYAFGLQLRTPGTQKGGKSQLFIELASPSTFCGILSETYSFCKKAKTKATATTTKKLLAFNDFQSVLRSSPVNKTKSFQQKSDSKENENELKTNIDRISLQFYF